MIESNVTTIFPTPIYTSKLNRSFTSKELSFFSKNESKTTRNEGNSVSTDHYVLNNKNLKELKKDIDLRIRDYFDKIIIPKDDVTPYITQSWLNYTKPGEFHHKHNHFNSYLSGVLYVNSDEKYDRIHFYKEVYQAIKLLPKQATHINADSMWFSVKTGDIILFPSSLVHMVETKQGNNLRTSLSFNVFIKGDIGQEKYLDKLELL